MQVNTSEVIECGDKLYYDINPNSKMDVPSMFYVRLETFCSLAKAGILTTKI